MKRVKHIIPRAVRSTLRRALEDALDAKAASYGLFLATAEQPQQHDRAGLVERHVGRVVQALEALVGITTGRDGDEQKTLPLAFA